MSDFTTIGKEFTNFYYAAFDRDRSSLRPLYRDISMLTFEGAPTLGTVSILEKLEGLPFQRVVHEVTTTDVQPTSDGKILVSVTGFLRVDGDANPLPFNQVFHLAPENQTYFVLNDIFRLNLG